VRNYVFIDESIRDSYVMAAVIVPINRLGEYRKAMAGLRTKGSLAFHMGGEKTAKQELALRTLLGVPGLSFRFALSKEKIRAQARVNVLESILESLDSQTFWTLVLDRTTQDRVDLDTALRIRRLNSLSLAVSHSNRYEDAGLWGADILAWSIGSPKIKSEVWAHQIVEITAR
jgi:hypothetical protein